MAEKKIIWKQKTGADSYDILYPRTLAENVTYGSGTVKDALDNIGTDLENKFVTLDTEQVIDAKKQFNGSIDVFGGGVGVDDSSDAGAVYHANGILCSEGGIPKDRVNEEGETSWFLEFPKTSGELALKSDIPKIGILPKGIGNAITDITASGHVLTVTKGTFATTATATQSTNGLMSSTDKSRLDSIWKLWTADGDDDQLVNKVEEALKVLENLSEGADLNALLASKADKSALDNYVTLDTDQTIDGSKTFREELKLEGISASFAPKLSFSEERSDREVTLGLDGFYVSDSDGERTITFPNKSGRLLVDGDIPKIPTSLPPSGNAGGDLTGTYPNPTIGAGKVTEAKIGSGAVTEGKIGANAVTTGKIKDANVTNAKLDTTGVTAGSYSIVTVNAQGRATAGSQLFTIGIASVIPSTVMTSAFYLQEVA